MVFMHILTRMGESMKSKKYLSLIVIGLLGLIAINTPKIKAWLQDIQVTNEMSFSVGEVSYTLTGEMIDTPVVPGQNLIMSPYQLNNYSTINSELRVKLTLTATGTDVSNLFSEILLTNNWIYNNEDDYYYYYVGPRDSTKVTTDQVNITVLEKLVLDGEVVNNSYANTKVTIGLCFEAKQFEYVTWEELGNINLTVGEGI